MRQALHAAFYALIAVSTTARAWADAPPDQDEPSGYMDPDGRSPVAALNPAESGLEVWIGPLILGVFALALLLLIRRYSKAHRQGKAQKDIEPRD